MTFRADGYVAQALRDYRERNRNGRADVGIMNFDGKLVCLDAAKELRDHITAREPLMAGQQFHML